MFHSESWKPIYFGLRGESHNVCVGFFTECNIAAAAAVYVSYEGFPGFSARGTSNVSHTGFSLCQFQVSACCWMLGFPPAWVSALL